MMYGRYSILDHSLIQTLVSYGHLSYFEGNIVYCLTAYFNFYSLFLLLMALGHSSLPEMVSSRKNCEKPVDSICERCMNDLSLSYNVFFCVCRENRLLTL